MTTCPRCGQQNRYGTSVCVACGLQLAGAPAAMPASEDGLPPWLRQMRANQQGGPGPWQQPAYPAGMGQPGMGGFGAPAPQAQPIPGQQWPGAPQMPAGNLVNEDALPEWLRAAGAAGGPAQPAPGGWPAGPAAAASGGQAPGYAPPPSPARGPAMGPGAQPASTLFDESALPDWLRQVARGHEIEPPPAPSAWQPSPGMPPAAPSPYGAPAPGQGFGMSPSHGAYPGYPQQTAQGPAPAAPSSYGAPPQPYQQNTAWPGAGVGNAFPSIEQAGSHQPPPAQTGGVAGQSLLDPSALPQWLSGQRGAPQAPLGGGPSNPGGMAAQSLIDENALPQWLRAEPPTPAAPAMPAAAPQPGQPNVSEWLTSSAASEPMPPWLSQMYNDTQGAQPQAPSAPTAATGMPPGGAQLAPSGGTLPANGLMDETALPDWLRSQAAEPGRGAPAQEERAAPRYVPGSGFGAAPESQPADENTGEEPVARFSASDLIDPDSLPSWAQGASGGTQAQPTFSSTSGWTSQMPEAGTSSHAGAAGPSGGWQSDELAASRGGTPPSLDWQGGVPADRDPWGQSSWQPNASWPSDSGYGGRAPDSARRRGPPIPPNELPPWLRGGQSGQGAAGGYPPAGAPRGQAPYQQYDQYGQYEQHNGDPQGYPQDTGAWSAEPGGEQWQNWDDGQQAGEPYQRERYQQPQGYPPQEHTDEREQRRGWRRFFGRR